MATKSLLVKLGGLTLLVIGVFAVRAYWSQGETEVQIEVESEPEASAAIAEASTPQPPGGPSEGIAVHGQWRIEVRNPDGTTAEVREFENALATQGEETLARLLAGIAYTGEWQIAIGGGGGLCLTDQGDPFICRITQTIDVQPYHFPNLSVTVEDIDQPGDNAMVLSGSAIMAANGQINLVSTDVVRPCVGDVDNGPECGANFTNPFTSTNITPIDVVADQSVLVTVNISFGSI